MRAASVDDEYQSVIKALGEGDSQNRHVLGKLYPLRHQLQVVDGLVLMNDKILVHKSCRAELLQLLHSSHRGIEATKHLWQQAGVRVLPGQYLSRTDETGYNPGAAYIRVALVQSADITSEALSLINETL